MAGVRVCNTRRRSSFPTLWIRCTSSLGKEAILKMGLSNEFASKNFEARFGRCYVSSYEVLQKLLGVTSGGRLNCECSFALKAPVALAFIEEVR